MQTISPIIQFLIENIPWICMIMLYPLWVSIGKIIAFLIMNKLYPQREIIIHYKKNGKIIAKKKVILDKDDPELERIKKEISAHE